LGGSGGRVFGLGLIINASWIFRSIWYPCHVRADHAARGQVLREMALKSKYLGDKSPVTHFHFLFLFPPLPLLQ
jgi:hypothetical protein